MVTVGTDVGLPSELSTQTAPNTPLLATSTVPTSLLFVVPRWRPRSGLTMAQHQFRRGAMQLFAAFGLAPAEADSSPPTIALDASPHTRRSAAMRPADADVRPQAAVLERWQRVNTAIYWHLLPAVDISGPHYLDDLAAVDSLVSGQLADGRGLLRWALSFVDLSSFEAQLALSNALGSVRLAPDASLVQLAAHLQKLSQVWGHTTAAAAEGPEALVQLYDYLVQSLPASYTSSATMHLVSLRTWLVGKLADFRVGGGSSVLSTYAEATKAILNHAATLGLPTGTQMPEAAHMAVISQPDGVKWQVDWANGGSKGGSLMPLTAPRTDARTPGGGGGGGSNGGGKKGNNCSFCPALACRSNDFREKVLKCISRHDSTFDLSKLSPGKRLVVTTLRNYHKAHPDATTLNDVDLKVTKAPKGGGGGGATGNAKAGQPTGALAAIVDYRDLVADGADSTREDFEAFIEELDAESPCIMMLGEVTEATAGDMLMIEACAPCAAAPAQVEADTDTATAPAEPDPSAAAVAAIEHAQAELARKDADMARMAETQREQEVAIARLERALQDAIVERRRDTPDGARATPTPVTAGLATPLGSMARALGGLASTGPFRVTTPVTDPALVPAEQQAAAAVAAAAEVAAISTTGSAVGGGEHDRTADRTATRQPSTLMPLVGSPPLLRRSSTGKSTALSADEHLASAALLLTQERNNKKKSKDGLLTRYTSKAVTTLAEVAQKWTLQQWATMLLVANGVRPWLQPALLAALNALVQRMMGATKHSLASALWRALQVILTIRTRITARTRAARADADAFMASINEVDSVFMMLGRGASDESDLERGHLTAQGRGGFSMEMACHTAMNPSEWSPPTTTELIDGYSSKDMEWIESTLKDMRATDSADRTRLVPHRRMADGKRERTYAELRATLRSMLLCHQMMRRKLHARALEWLRRFKCGWNGKQTPFAWRRYRSARGRHSPHGIHAGETKDVTSGTGDSSSDAEHMPCDASETGDELSDGVTRRAILKWIASDKRDTTQRTSLSVSIEPTHRRRLMSSQLTSINPWCSCLATLSMVTSHAKGGALLASQLVRKTRPARFKPWLMHGSLLKMNPP